MLAFLDGKNVLDRMVLLFGFSRSERKKRSVGQRLQRMFFGYLDPRVATTLGWNWPTPSA